MKKLLFAIFAACALPLMAQDAPRGAAPLSLVYQAENKWVAQEDNEPLRALIQRARVEGFSHFQVQLPAEGREVSIRRLEVLVDILEQSLKRGILIEEVRGDAEANTLNIYLIK